MSFIHCHNCQWNQDDFWSVDGYNPFRKDVVDWWKDIFARGMRGEKIEMDLHWAEEAKIPYEIGTKIVYLDKQSIRAPGQENVNSYEAKVALIDFRDMLAFEMEHVAKEFYNMEWPTFEEFKEEENRACPQCGSTQDLDID